MLCSSYFIDQDMISRIDHFLINFFVSMSVPASGKCPPGYYCPIGTSISLQCPQNSFSLAGSYVCTVCPGKGSRFLPMPCQIDKSCCYKKSI